MNDFTQIQLRTFKSFLGFSLITLIFAIIFINSNSQKYRISQIDINFSNNLDFSSIDTLYGSSIWFVDENSFENIYIDNPEIKNLSITKKLPNNLTLSVQLYEELTNITDSRSSTNKVIILYENTYTIATEKVREELPNIEIINGPVGDGFNGELISFFKTLNKYDYRKNSLRLVYDGAILEAYYDKATYVLGEASDLGRKASVVGAYLIESKCEGVIRFITPESTIEDCT